MFYATFNAGGITLMVQQWIYGNEGNCAYIWERQRITLKTESYQDYHFVVTGDGGCFDVKLRYRYLIVFVLRKVGEPFW